MSIDRGELESLIARHVDNPLVARRMTGLLDNLTGPGSEPEQPTLPPGLRVRVSIELDVSEPAWRQRYALHAMGLGDTGAHVAEYVAGLVADAVPVRDGTARVVDVTRE